MLEFDWKLGPQVRETIGVEDGEFTDEQLSSLRTSAFPESANPRAAVAPIFAFVIDTYYCYCLFQILNYPNNQLPHLCLSREHVSYTLL